jgi:hypothetical protein
MDEWFYAHVAIYNYFVQQWDYDYWSASSSTFSNFANQYGIVAWTNGSYAHAAVFDVVTEQWDYDYWSASSSTFANFRYYKRNSNVYQRKFYYQEGV